jgi:glycosyltransferase involved in cell wall biosynthesis
VDKDLVSIIMPAFNACKYIADGIESVLAQTYKNWELIIIDDGSTDNTAAIAAYFRNIDHRIKYLYQENGRQGKARNLGIKNSSGKYIAFLDADDKWTENKLSVQTAILDKDKSIDLIFSPGYCLFENGIENYGFHIKDFWDSSDFKDFLENNRIPILSVVVKKQTLLSVGGFTEKNDIQNAEDYHLWLKLLIYGSKFKSINDRLFYYRIHKGQSTYENANITVPIFNTYKDIYHQIKNTYQKKLVVNKLKWYIFQEEFHVQCINLFSFHFKQKGLKIISFAVKKLFANPKPTQERVVFYLISIFG